MTATEIELPTATVVEEARRALRQLSDSVPERGFDRVLLRTQVAREAVEATVPGIAFRLFLDVLAQLSNGNAVTVVPVRAELTTQEAAELLNVSRPHVVRLMETGEMPFRKVGTHRRVSASDVLEYKRKDDARRRAIAGELSEMELG